jgi:hypothetical protein
MAAIDGNQFMRDNHAVLNERWKAMLAAPANQLTLLNFGRFAQLAIQKPAEGLRVFSGELEAGGSDHPASLGAEIQMERLLLVAGNFDQCRLTQCEITVSTLGLRFAAERY